MFQFCHLEKYLDMGGGGGNKNQSAFGASAATGVAVIMEMLSGGLFMENVKMEKQRTSRPYADIMGQTLRQGMRGWTAGFWPWGFVLGMTKGSVLGGSRAFLLRSCKEDFGMSKSTADLVSGFGAGAVQGVFMSPILLARTRVNQSLAERAAKEGVIKSGLLNEMKMSTLVLNQAIKEEGVGVIFKGMPAMVFKRALDWGTRFIFIGIFKRQLEANKGGEKLTDMEDLAASFFGGAASVAITMPIDRMMPILQQSGASSEGFVTILKKKIATEGITTLQRGFLMRTVHTGYHTMFATFVAAKIYSLFE